jgi:hypothetical protein
MPRNGQQSVGAVDMIATVADNGAWRILVRVTYVSRIPPTGTPDANYR